MHYEDLSRDDLIRLLREYESAPEADRDSKDARLKTEERLRFAAEAAQFGIYDADLVSGAVYWSPQMRAILGVSAEAKPPAPGEVPEFVHPDDVESVRQMFRQAFDGAGDGSVLHEHRIVQPDGAVRWVQLKGRVHFEREGAGRRGTRASGIVLDVTERKQIEQALRASEALNRQTLGALPAHVAVLDAQGRIIAVNRAWTDCAENNGAAALPRESVGADYLAVCRAAAGQDADAARALAGLEAVLTGLLPAFTMEYLCHGRSREQWFLMTVVPSREDREGGLVVTHQDITGRKKTEESLQEAVSFLQAALDSTADGLLMVDLDGRITGFNRQFANLWRIPEAVLAARDDSQALAFVLEQLVDPDAFLEKVRQLYARPDQASADVLEFKDGRVFERFSQPQWLNGQPVGRVWSFRDVTARKRAEAALQEADRRKDEFLATLAHELRNPMAPIRSAVEILKLQGTVDPASQSALGIIDRQVRHMVRLIDDLLDISRITRGRIELRRERVELATVLEQALEGARPHIERMGHQLAVSLPAEAVYLDADPVRLTQVFGNLLHNACKYMERGGHIELSAEVDGAEAVVRVADAGIGIPPEMVSRLFEMFTQLDAHRAHAQGGLGLGLALAHRLVTMHGGTIAAASPGAGAGSTFTVRLPLADATRP